MQQKNKKGRKSEQPLVSKLQQNIVSVLLVCKLSLRNKDKLYSKWSRRLRYHLTIGNCTELRVGRTKYFMGESTSNGSGRILYLAVVQDPLYAPANLTQNLQN